MVGSSVERKSNVILAEIIGATDLRHPKKDSVKPLQPFVVASLVGKGRSNVLQRTKRKKQTADPIWCAPEDRCLFLISVPDDIKDNSLYNIQFDVRDKDTTDPFSCTLIGSQKMPLNEILGICEEKAEERIELKLQDVQNKKGRLSHQEIASSRGKYDPLRKNNSSLAEEDSANLLAVRFRFASSLDQKFMQELEQESVGTIASLWNDATKSLNITLSPSNEEVRLPRLITEISTQEVGVNNVLNMFTKKTSRGKDGKLRIRVQPCPDTRRIATTTYLSEEELQCEMYEPSSNWVQCGTDTKESLGMVFLEVLRCEGLPNMDAGGALGNKTDAFVCAVYEENLVQTDVIDDRLSPMWMPWTQRAFCFQMHHSLSQLYISVNDFDLGLSPHDGIGRIAVNLNHFESDVAYTLKYKIHPAANIYGREDLGTITIRLRKHINNERAFLLASLKPIPRLHVNMVCQQTLPVANFTVYGTHNEDHYDIQLLRDYINEIIEVKRFLVYAIGDSFSSLMMWRGQVKVGSCYLPIYSFVAFFGGIFIVERPHLLPGCFFLTIAWIMLASMMNRLQHPSPWHKTNSFVDYLSMLRNEKLSKRKTVIKRMENHEEAEKYEANWDHRIKSDVDAAWKVWDLQLEMNEIGNEDMNTEVKKKSADPLALALQSLKPRLFPIQVRLKGYCKTIRLIKAVTSWEESIISFWITLICTIIGVALLILPTVFLLHWTFRLLIWIGLGPWRRCYGEMCVNKERDPFDLHNDEDRDKHQEYTLEKISQKFKEKKREARLKGEEALKMKAMRVFRFGRHIAKVPRLYTARHYDYPMCESEAAHISIADQHTIPPQYFESKNIIPAQHLEGEMIPLTEAEVDVLLREAEKEISTGKVVQTPALAAKLQHREIGKEMECLLQSEGIVRIEEIDEEESDSLHEFISFDNEDEFTASAKISTHLIKDEAIEDQNYVMNPLFLCGTGIAESDDEGDDSNDKDMNLQSSLTKTSQCTNASVVSTLEEEGVEIIACAESESEVESVEICPSVGMELGSRDDDTSKSLSHLYKSSDRVFVSFCR